MMQTLTRLVNAKQPLLQLEAIRSSRSLLVKTAKGRAAHDAAMGEAVRVVNTRSKTAVEGIVEAPNRVLITALGAMN